MSADFGMPVEIDVRYQWRDPQGWLRDDPPRTGPGERVVVVKATFRKGHGDLGLRLAGLAQEEGLLAGFGGADYMVGPGVDYRTLMGATVTLLGAAGGIGGIAALLKVFFERNNAKKVTFGERGEVLAVEGLAVDEVVRLLEELHERRRAEETGRGRASGPAIPGESVGQDMTPPTPELRHGDAPQQE
ncbi:hypothetical protein [Streptomyces sp. bgisy060]|uniref:hypothetical protein n=1 Tax=Streptomyces sp. bgisy060 TaxID=3413775 RepID=UPI003EBC70C4